MFRFILGRLAVLIPTFIGVTIVSFAFIRLLPGDPIMLLSGERVMEPERYEALTKQFGYDRPYMSNI
jgi:dipeptide transport system permease protein